MKFAKVKDAWRDHEPAILAGLLFGCGIIIGAALTHIHLHLGKF